MATRCDRRTTVLRSRLKRDFVSTISSFQALGRDYRQISRKTQGTLSSLNLSQRLGAFEYPDGLDSCKKAWVKTFLGQPRRDTFRRLVFGTLAQGRMSSNGTTNLRAVRRANQ